MPKAEVEAPAFQYVFPASLLARPKELTFNVKLVSWSYLNFQMKVSPTAQLYSIAKRISDQHSGSVRPDELVVYIDRVSPETRFTDFTKTFEECPLIQPGQTEYEIFYDFTTPNTGCPLLLSSPRPGHEAQDTIARMALDSRQGQDNRRESGLGVNSPKSTRGRLSNVGDEEKRGGRNSGAGSPSSPTAGSFRNNILGSPNLSSTANRPSSRSSLLVPRPSRQSSLLSPNPEDAQAASDTTSSTLRTPTSSNATGPTPPPLSLLTEHSRDSILEEGDEDDD